MSILLACIAEALGPDGQYGDWTAQIIREDRLTNRGKAPEKHRKLRLQHGDDDEYRLGLEGKTVGAGAVSQGWRIARRLVARKRRDPALRGPQAAPGRQHRTRTEGGSPADLREPERHRPARSPRARRSRIGCSWGYRTRSSRTSTTIIGFGSSALSAPSTRPNPPTSSFGTSFAGGTGEMLGIDRVYEGLRRWAVRQGLATDRPTLCRDLARLAGLYGIITGTAKTPPQSEGGARTSAFAGIGN